jgi:hypothetical protein
MATPKKLPYEDEVLRRMLTAAPKAHEDMKVGAKRKAPAKKKAKPR